MLNKMQALLIQWVLDPLYRVTKLVPKKVWNVLMTLSVLGIVMMQFAISAGLVTRYLFSFLPFCLFVGIIILAGLSEDMKPVPFSPVMLVCWLGMAACITVSGVLVNRDSLGDAMLWLVAFPILFIVWCNRPFAELAKSAVNGVYLSFLALVLMMMWKYPISSINYRGFFLNSNGLAMYCTAVFVTALADILTQKRFSVRIVLGDVILGMSASISYCTNSRACQYMMVVVAVFAAVLFLVIHREKLVKTLLCYALPAVLAVVILLPGGVTVINSGAKAIDKIEKAFVQQDAAAKPNAGGASAQTQEKVDTFEAIRRRNEERQGQSGDGDFTTGRTELWGIYLSEVGVLGHSSDNKLYYDNGDVVTKSAHNTLIQMAYEYGAVAALFFLALNLVSGIKALIYAYQNRALDYSIFPVLVAVGYGGYYLVEKMLYPSQCLLLLLYVLTQAAVFTKKKKTKTVQPSDE